VNAAMEMSLTDTLAMERESQRIAGKVLTTRRAWRRFLEKRKPKFEGKSYQIA
jgi:hypothetical protein